VDLNAVLICISFMARDGENFFHVCFFSFCRPGRSVCPRAMLVYPRVGVGVPHAAYLPTCWSAGCLPSRFRASGAGALLFSQCNVAWRSFVQAEGSGCQSFNSSWCFFSAKYGSILSAKFLIYGAHAVCFCTLVAILDQLFEIFVYLKPGNVYICSKSSVGVLDN
jgi:hypothetical protein